MTSRAPVLAIVLALTALPIAAAQDHAAPAPAAEPAPHLRAGPPLPGPLSKGLVVIAFRTENLKILPVYGPAAQQVVPRLGHLHITIDGAPWHWVQASDEPVVVQGLSQGPHRVLLELADANHTVVDTQTVSFDIPARPASN